MTRGKVKLDYIVNDSLRKATFNKRKGGLMKAAEELSTLCAIQTCVILFSPHDLEPDVWPSKLGAQRVIARFRNLPEFEQTKRMMDQEKFTRQRVTKENEQVMKLGRENHRKEMTNVMYRCLYGKGFESLSVDNLRELDSLLKQNMRDIDKRIEFLDQCHCNGE